MDLMSLFERMSGLAADPSQFERERERVLAEAMQATSEDRRSHWLQLQSELEAMRERLTPENFCVELFRRMGENVENMGDLFDAIRVKLDDFHPDRPRLQQVRALAGAR